MTTVSGGLLQAGNLLVVSGGFDGDINVSGGNVVANFIEIKNAGGAKLDISGGTDLVNWPITSTYTVGADTDGSASGVTILKNNPEIGKDTITLSRSQSGLPTKLVARLSVGIK
jgi:hypothetical protein